MKVFWKVLASLVAIAGIVFVVVTYGDKIAAFFKKRCCKCGEDCQCEEIPAEEVAEEAPAAEEVVEEAPIEEVVVEAAEPVAEEADFEA